MSDASQNRRKRKANFKKARYFSSKHPRKDESSNEPTNLTPGMRGFIVTCNKRERQSGFEALHLLNDAFQRVTSDGEEDDASGTDVEEEEDIEEAMRQEADREAKKGKFKPVATGVSNVIFITSSATNRSPTSLVNEVFADLIGTRRSVPRFALRMLPVEAVCRIDDRNTFHQLCCSLWSEFIDHHRVKRNAAPTFAVDYKSRNFSAKTDGDASSTQPINKDAAVAAWVAAVKARTPEYKVDMISPSVWLVVNVLRKCVCLSILEFKTEFAKYNLHEVLAANPKPTHEKEGNANGSGNVDSVDGSRESKEKGEVSDEKNENV